MVANSNNNEDEEKPISSFIPHNFADSGRVVDGMFFIRNLIEAAIFILVLGYIEYNILLDAVSVPVMMGIMAMTIGPIGIFAVIGINGDSFTVFLAYFFSFLKNKRKLRYRRIQKEANNNNSSIMFSSKGTIKKRR